MNLENILIFTTIALLLRFLSPSKGRNFLLFLTSILAIYWLQPISPIRNLDFWLPTLTLSLVFLSWLLTTPREELNWQQNIKTTLILVGLIILIALTRFIRMTGVLTASRPPQFGIVLLTLVFLFIIIFLGYHSTQKWKNLSQLGIVLFITILICIKSPFLAGLVSSGLRSLMQQSSSLANAADIRWLGFSYLAFRIIHTLRDKQNGRLTAVTLQEYFIYVIFFPSFTAGPIARLDRFIKDLRKPLERFNNIELINAGKRLALGLFKKFVLANGLAVFSLSNQNVFQVQSSGWMWVMIYAYALQIYFDFSGYTDIAIGLGKLIGFN
ncbi:MAG: hypothetical protein JEZ06_08380 [Anaerolineaceae bacterium]|nr:hypothetical protein [Anaerolineaceae bacterium]